MLSMPINANIKKQIPQKSGIYIFSKGKTPIYIGKAANLKKRLAQYFRKNSGGKIGALIHEATNIRWEEAESETEALVKEAELIKRHIPKYNVLMRDDKNYFYVAITKENFPRIFITHQPGALKAAFIGPFTSGRHLKTALRAIRTSFPYCTCKKSHKRPCLHSSIGRCPGYCCLQNKFFHEGDFKQYRENVSYIAAILRGRQRSILRNLKRSMRRAAETQDFERAARLRNQVYSIGNIFSHTRVQNLETKFPSSKIKRTLQAVLKTKKDIRRVEGYDISHISGREATGSMVVFIDGRPSKSDYRKFKIKTIFESNDVAMLKEVLRRRLDHPEWKYPDLMLIDGGKQQLNATLSVMGRRGRGIFVAGLAKREEELHLKKQKRSVPLSTLPNHTAFFFQRVRDESHRFAKKYHHILRKKVLSDEINANKS